MCWGAAKGRALCPPWLGQTLSLAVGEYSDETDASASARHFYTPRPVCSGRGTGRRSERFDRTKSNPPFCVEGQKAKGLKDTRWSGPYKTKSNTVTMTPRSLSRGFNFLIFQFNVELWVSSLIGRDTLWIGQISVAEQLTLWSLLDIQILVLLLIIHNWNNLCLVKSYMNCDTTAEYRVEYSAACVPVFFFFSPTFSMWLNGPERRIDPRRRTIRKQSSSRSRSSGGN